MCENLKPVPRLSRSASLFPAMVFVALLLSFAGVARAAFAWESIRLVDAVTDQAGMLSQADRLALEYKLGQYEAATGNALVLVTLKDLDGGDIDDAANRIYQKAGIGKKGVDKGALLLVSLGDRKMRIEVGYGLEGVLTDSICASIIHADMVPAFKSGNFAQGINAAFDRMEKIASGDASAVPTQPKGDAGMGFLIVFFSIAFVLIMLGAIFGKEAPGSRNRYGRGPFIGGGGFGGGGGGGGSFGGFGGGMSGGGGASGGW